METQSNNLDFVLSKQRNCTLEFLAQLVKANKSGILEMSMPAISQRRLFLFTLFSSWQSLEQIALSRLFERASEQWLFAEEGAKLDTIFCYLRRFLLFSLWFLFPPLCQCFYFRRWDSPISRIEINVTSNDETGFPSALEKSLESEAEEEGLMKCLWVKLENSMWTSNSSSLCLLLQEWFIASVFTYCVTNVFASNVYQMLPFKAAPTSAEKGEWGKFKLISFPTLSGVNL